MQLETSERAEALIVTVQDARIDAAVAIQFKDAMREITATDHPRVVLDLSTVEFLDSSGLGAVVGAMKQLGAVRRLDLAGLTPAVAKVFRLTRMDTVFAIFETVEAALAPGADAA